MATVACVRIFEQLEAQRAEVLAELAAWPSDRLSFRPAPGAWSAVEVLDHIVRAETETLVDLRNGFEHPRTLGKEDRPNVAALDRALRSDRRFQVPEDAVTIQPDARTTLPEVATRWEKTRMEMRSLVDALEPKDARCGVFFHPFAGWMTVTEVLDHFSAHLHHHRFQLERLR